MLNHFRAVHVGHHDWSHERLITFFIRANARSLFDPTTIRSGFIRSATAHPSLRNSGLLTTSKSTPALLYLRIVWATFSLVLTGTVLLSTMTRYSLSTSAISRATRSM